MPAGPCECRHRVGIHWRGTGRCGYYEADVFSGKFDAKGKAITAKKGACSCTEFKPQALPPAA